MKCRPAKTQFSLGIRPVWSMASLCACRNHDPLTTHSEYAAKSSVCVCVSSSRCRGLVCGLWLWYFMDILTCYFNFLSEKAYAQTDLSLCWIHEPSVRGSRVLSEGVQLWQRLFSFSWSGERGSKYHLKWAIIGPPAERHLNGISLACRWRPNIECWLGRFVIVIRTSIAKKPYIFVTFQGGPDPLPPASGCARAIFAGFDMHWLIWWDAW